MKMNEYQKQAITFAKYEDVMYPVVALAEETGELSSIFAKYLRGDERYLVTDESDPNCGGLTYEALHMVEKEAGDVLWQLSAILSECQLELGDVAKQNLKKLNSRNKRGLIKGDGDDR